MNFLIKNPLDRIRTYTDFFRESNVRKSFNHEKYITKNDSGSKYFLNPQRKNMVFKPYFNEVKSILYCLMLHPVDYHNNPSRIVDNWYDFTYPMITNGTMYEANDKSDYEKHIMCQNNFIKKLKSKKNPNSQITETDLTNYEKFIYLFKKHGNSILVPTYRIDVVWHAHMLDHNQYVDDMKKILGRILDHNDDISVPILRDSLDRTSNLWEKEFGTKYAATNSALGIAGMVALSSVIDNSQYDINQYNTKKNNNSGCASCYNFPAINSISTSNGDDGSCGGSSCGGGGGCGGGD